MDRGGVRCVLTDPSLRQDDVIPIRQGGEGLCAKSSYLCLMIFPLYIAKRYLIAKKSHNIINIISIISVIGVMVGTGALIIVLSVFNGFEGLVLGFFNSFNPDLKVAAIEGNHLPEPGTNDQDQTNPGGSICCGISGRKCPGQVWR